jgi:hypothetical protein
MEADRVNGCGGTAETPRAPAKRSVPPCLIPGQWVVAGQDDDGLGPAFAGKDWYDILLASTANDA